MTNKTDVAVKTDKPSFLQQMTANVNVGVDEVVSVFVAKWETALHDKKDKLSKQIKAVKKQLSDQVDSLIGSVDTEQYVMDIPVLNLTSKIGDVGVVWGKTYKTPENMIVVEVRVYDTSEKSRDYPVHTKNVLCPVSADNVKLHDDLTKELETLNSELIEVMGEIKSVSRKERQVRGKLSEMKLEQSGFADLANSPDILQLIEIK